MKSFLIAILFAACASSSSTSVPDQPRPGPTTPAPGPSTADPSPTPPPADPTPPAPKPAGGPAIGETCGADDSCAAGAECVKYYGIAGARGPQFKSCEIKCGPGGTCPAGRTCRTIADGPGAVCR